MSCILPSLDVIRAAQTARPMTGFIATLSPEQREAAKAYRGDETHGDEAFALSSDGPASAWAPLAIIIVSLAFWAGIGSLIWAGVFGEFVALSVIAALAILAMSRGVV